MTVAALAPSGTLRRRHLVRSGGTYYVCTLIEPARTNLHTYSQDFSDSVLWPRLDLSAPVPNAALGIDGVNFHATKLTENTAASSQHGLRKALTTYGLTENAYQQQSWILGAAERTVVGFETVGLDNVTARTWFDLATGVVGTVAATHTPFVTQITDTLYLCDLVWNAGSGASSPSMKLLLATGDGVASYTGDGLSGIYAAQADFQANIEGVFPTTPILTEGDEVTRPADVHYEAYNTPPRERTLLLSFVERGAIATTSGTLTYVGNAANTGARFWVESSGTYYRATYHNGTTSRTSTLSAAPSYGNRVDLLVTQRSTGEVQIGQRIDGATETTATESASLALPSSWSDRRRYYGSKGGSQVGCVAFCTMPGREIAILEQPGLCSWDQMLARRGTLEVAA